MTKIFSLVTLMSIAAPAFAQPSTLPKPVTDMECLVGAWKGGGTVSMGKDTAKISAAWTCKRTSSKYGVLCTFHVAGIPGMPSYEETDLMGFEPNTNTYHWYSVTNAGETHDHVAKLPDGNRLQFVYTGTQEGKAFKEVIALNFANDSRSVVGRAETFVSGVSASVMQINLHK